MTRRQDEIRQYYEQRYRGRARPRIAQNLKRVRSNFRGMHVSEGDRVLDVGCGLGTAGVFLADQGATPFGIDISLEAAKASLQAGGYVSASQANAESLPFADVSFDLAAFLGTLEHFVDPVKALHEAKRVLKPGAQICFVVPNSNFFLFKVLEGTGQPHEMPRTYEGWRQLFEEKGLSIEKVYRDVGPGVFDGRSLWRGLLRRCALSLSSLLPMRHTYQFVFICRNLLTPRTQDEAGVPCEQEHSG